MRRVFLLAILVTLRLPAQDSKPQDPKKDPDQIGTRDVSKGINFYSLEKEMAMGRSMSQEVERHATLVTDKLITEYVNRIGQNLARNSDSKIPLTVKVIEDKAPNAVTLPGGYIYVNTGLLRMADTEAEFAAALAHEIGHVAARHATRQATQSQVSQVATIPLIFLGGWGGICARSAAALIVPPAYMATLRGNEAEADLLGLQYLYKSGYDPLGMVDIFEKILAFDVRRHKILTAWTSTHPESDDRLSNVQKNIETLLKAKPEYIVNTSEFDNAKAHLAALDWIPKPVPTLDTDRPTLRRKGDQLIASKKAVPESDARASQIKEAYTIR
jgi:predicted Zn-dependent protease